MQTATLIISLVSVVTAGISIVVAVRAVAYARHSVVTSILVELRESYSTEEMNRATHYLMKLRSEHADEIQENPYSFARRYLDTVSTDSPEWQMRRRVSHFFNHLASLVENGLIDEEAVFAMWAMPEVEIIEFLEPIETIIGERYYPRHPLPYDRDWLALHLLERCRGWQRKQRRRKLDCRFTLPRNEELYKQSLEPPRGARAE